ncbi:MAG: LacI family DNA-binding transcriptional regulator [Verrucomicrobiales bacterium]|nr:LacI family DNA-binding transcriptional regulator [Verrucomicrobiales bacterium]
MPNARKSTCTMRTVAAHLGISHATVSRALRDDPRISREMRLKVTKAASELGYRRDPKLAQLMSHVRATKARAHQGTLAWVTDHDLDIPAENAAHHLYWEFAVKRAEQLGYKLERFTKTGPAEAPKLERRLRALGIEGVIIQQYKARLDVREWKFQWQHFAALHNGSSQVDPTLDSVDADDVGNCVQVFAKLADMGHRRIGICTTVAIEIATNYCLSTGWQRFRLLHPGHEDIPSCLLPDLGPDASRVVKRWLKRHRIDAVASQVRGMKDLLESTGRRVPEDLSLAYQGVNPHGPNSGIWQREDLMAGALIETVVAAIEQDRLGLPAIPRLTLISGRWHPGTTAIARQTTAVSAAK